MGDVLIVYVFLGAAVVLIPAGIGLVASGLRRCRRTRIVAGVCCLVLSGLLFWRIQHAHFWTVDTCLDAGGRYDYEMQQCEFNARAKRPTTGQPMNLLDKQLAMNETTFARLRERGLTPDTDVQLEFSYVAPGEQQARALQRMLTRETDYAARATALNDSTWAVTGVTKPTTITLEVVNEWVTWMVSAGLQYDCVFDGWGTEL